MRGTISTDNLKLGTAAFRLTKQIAENNLREEN